MNIHEYQGKAVLKEIGAPVSKGIAIFDASEARAAAEELGGPLWVVKSQIHAGGRGKGKFVGAPADAKGGVRLAFSVDDVVKNAEDMLGEYLVTEQTSDEGKQVNRLYIEHGSDIDRELYLSIIINRETSRVSFIVSTDGGTLAKALDLKGDLAKQANTLGRTLYNGFLAKDMAMLEINPLIVTEDQRLHCLDAKISFDENALYRHPDVQELRDITEEDAKETEAKKYDLSYVALDGNIGCMVNGAGLAMSTMDIIKLYGAEPANFLDVGGGATKENIVAAFKILTSDAKVEGILINIFGGIMKCDVIAQGTVDAVKEVGLQVPLVVRLEGTNVEAGKEIINNSGLNVIAADDLDDAAQKIVAAVKVT